jgi:hypothetical protein
VLNLFVLVDHCRMTLEMTRNLGYVAAVEEFALQNFPQTRATSDGFKAASCTARLAPNFHHKHVQPPLTGFFEEAMGFTMCDCVGELLGSTS